MEHFDTNQIVRAAAEAATGSGILQAEIYVVPHGGLVHHISCHLLPLDLLEEQAVMLSELVETDICTSCGAELLPNALTSFEGYSVRIIGTAALVGQALARSGVTATDAGLEDLHALRNACRDLRGLGGAVGAQDLTRTLERQLKLVESSMRTDAWRLALAARLGGTLEGEQYLVRVILDPLDFQQLEFEGLAEDVCLAFGPGGGLAQVPAGMLDALSRVATTAERCLLPAPDVLEAALVLWDPSSDGSYETLGAAIGAARAL